MRPSTSVARRIINCDPFQGQIFRAINTKYLHWRILDRYPTNAGRCQAVRVEELRLRFPAVAALAVPPPAALPVEDGAGGTGDGDVGAGDGN